MKTVQISLNSIGKVKSFVNAISQFEYDFDLISSNTFINCICDISILQAEISQMQLMKVLEEDMLKDI